MTAIGYALSSEEHAPLDLVRHAAMAEEAGFSFALISDHFHPWIERQGNSPFVWGVLGAIAQATEHLEIGTGVTCPTMRTHPAIIAHASATAAALMPGRFFLGVGTGENLNDHILGDGWPDWEIRAEMLEEAVGIIRDLWTGEEVSHRGEYYLVRNAKLYTPPPEGAAHPRRRQWSGRGASRRSHRRRIHRDWARKGPPRRLPGGRWGRPALRAGHRVLGRVGEGGSQDRARVVADCGDPRRGDRGAALARGTSSS